MKQKTINKLKEYFEWKRDLTLELLQLRELEYYPDYEEILGHFNNEINVLQFLIENINDKQKLQDNPYLYGWLKESIQDNIQNRGNMFRDLNNLMIHLYEESAISKEA